MISSQQKEPWDPYVDKVICAVWNGKENQAAEALLSLQTAFKHAEANQVLDAQLLEALHRLADFYCLERRFDEVQNLFAAVQRAHQKASPQNAKSEKVLEFRRQLQTLKQLSDLQKTNSIEGASRCARIDDGW